MINTRLLSHPMNWIIILLMLILAGIFGHLVLSYFGHEPKTGGPISATGQGFQTVAASMPAS